MTKIDIVSGFLGAGKTTLIKKLLAEAYKGEKLVLIENEFGEIRQLKDRGHRDHRPGKNRQSVQHPAGPHRPRSQQV